MIIAHFSFLSYFLSFFLSFISVKMQLWLRRNIVVNASSAVTPVAYLMAAMSVSSLIIIVVIYY